MFGYVIVFCSEEIQNLSQVIIIVKTLQFSDENQKDIFFSSFDDLRDIVDMEI